MVRKKLLLAISAVFAAAIIIWPIAFSASTLIGLIELGISELFVFIVIELVLISGLIIYWELYKHKKK